MILIIGGSHQGKTIYAQTRFPKEWTIENHYHLKIKSQLKKEENPLEEAQKILKTTKNLIIISDEVGYGLVPADAFEREYREMVGRVNCFFAAQAEQVIRVVCGIGTRIG